MSSGMLIALFLIRTCCKQEIQQHDMSPVSDCILSVRKVMPNITISSSGSGKHQSAAVLDNTMRVLHL